MHLLPQIQCQKRWCSFTGKILSSSQWNLSTRKRECGKTRETLGHPGAGVGETNLRRLAFSDLSGCMARLSSMANSESSVLRAGTSTRSWSSISFSSRSVSPSEPNVREKILYDFSFWPMIWCMYYACHFCRRMIGASVRARTNKEAHACVRVDTTTLNFISAEAQTNSGTANRKYRLTNHLLFLRMRTAR